MTIELGPQLSKTLLIFSLGGAQFHRLEGSRGVYLFDEPNTIDIDPGGSSRDHVDGSSPLRVTLSTELAGDQLNVSYSIAGSDGENPVTFETIGLSAGPMQLGIQARWASSAPDDNATIVLENLRCP